MPDGQAASRLHPSQHLSPPFPTPLTPDCSGTSVSLTLRKQLRSRRPHCRIAIRAFLRQNCHLKPTPRNHNGSNSAGCAAAAPRHTEIAQFGFYIQSGRMKIIVVSAAGKEAVIAVVGAHSFL